jgi:hypothetical protein
VVPDRALRRARWRGGHVLGTSHKQPALQLQAAEGVHALRRRAGRNEEVRAAATPAAATQCHTAPHGTPSSRAGSDAKVRCSRRQTSGSTRPFTNCRLTQTAARARRYVVPLNCIQCQRPFGADEPFYPYPDGKVHAQYSLPHGRCGGFHSPAIPWLPLTLASHTCLGAASGATARTARRRRRAACTAQSRSSAARCSSARAAPAPSL